VFLGVQPDVDCRLKLWVQPKEDFNDEMGLKNQQELEMTHK
jgi:hypothetical protein